MITFMKRTLKFYEGMKSAQVAQNNIDGKKAILINPSTGQRSETETVSFAEGEVYGMDILVSSGGEGKVRC